MRDQACGAPVAHEYFGNGCLEVASFARRRALLRSVSMKRKSPRPSAATSEFLLPQPSAGGVARLRELYFNRTGRRITEDEARDVLSRLMRFQHLNVLTNAPCPGTASTPESPTTTAS